MNKVILMGRISREIEVGMTKTGKSQVRFTIATDKYGNDKEKTANFTPCIAWGKTAEFIGRYFEKGRRILVDGTLDVQNVKDDNGNWKTYVNVIIYNAEFVDSKPTGGSGGNNAGNSFGQSVPDDSNIQF